MTDSKDNKTTEKLGRPTKWSKELEQEAWEYADGGWKEAGDAIPSVVGLCKVLNRARSTLYAWADDDEKAFSDILAAINENQELTTLNGSLKGDLNAAISKLVLGKHGYQENHKMDATVVEVTQEQWLDSLK